jgi:hypothetical protein
MVIDFSHRIEALVTASFIYILVVVAGQPSRARLNSIQASGPQTTESETRYTCTVEELNQEYEEGRFGVM